MAELSRLPRRSAGILLRVPRFDKQHLTTEGWGQVLGRLATIQPASSTRRTGKLSNCVTALTLERLETADSDDEYALSRVSRSPRQPVGPRQPRVSQSLSLSDNFTAGDRAAARASRGRVRPRSAQTRARRAAGVLLRGCERHDASVEVQ